MSIKEKKFALSVIQNDSYLYIIFLLKNIAN